MADLKQYIVSSGAGELPAAAELDALLARCEWFDLARIVREIATGRPDPRLDVTAPWRAQSSLRMAAVDADALCRLSSDDIIDRFLREEDLRIVAADGEPEEEVCTEAVLDDDDRERGTGGNLSCPGASGQSHSDLSQIKFAKSRKKCLLCRANWQIGKQ